MFPYHLSHSVHKLFLSFDLYSYALVATATDYDAWRPQSSAVTAAEVFKTLKANADTSRHVAATILGDLHAALSASGEQTSDNLLSEELGSMKYSIMPRSEPRNVDDLKKLAFILPEYFAES